MRIELDIPLTLGFIKESLQVPAKDKDFKIYIKAITSDTRNAHNGDLFLALKGENFDGEDFISFAKKIGTYTLSAKDKNADIYVKDTLSSLLTLAKEYKRLFPIKHTIAITGSVGKTTTKDLISNLLSSKFKTHSTYKNLNNEIGVPFTILSLKKDTEVLIIEAGMNHSGELTPISECLEPTISVITKIGNAHIGNLGSRKNIAKAKSEIVSGMVSPFAIIPHDEPLLGSIPSRKTVSVNERNANFCLSPTVLNKNALKFDYYSDKINLRDITFPNPESHIAECLAFAISVCIELQMNNNEIQYALSKLDFSKRSKNIIIKDLTIIDDSYNSSPEAVLSAFKTLQLYDGIHSALLGDMLELGNMSEMLHFQIGKLAGENKLSKLYLFGKNAKYIKEGALSVGFDSKSVFINEDIEKPEITAYEIKKHSHEEVILFKASRKLKLERIIDILKEL